jgi:2-keto-4-pentenoate hydratase/2-oxohepta-3-ene-1,7-dioic acid hydratase in catechol pathway
MADRSDRAGEPIVIPKITTQVDYEAELGVVIGSRVRGVSAEDALAAVAARTPPVWLRPGDELTVEIDGIGALTNPVMKAGS